jgi:CHAT domain-containing protein
VLHLATHAFFFSGDCELQSGERSIVAKRIDPLGTEEARPLHLSGFALADANEHMSHQDGEDGLVVADEIAAMNLESVELVVLSACDTGVGETKTGEGVVGLRRAFRVAGARSLVMSLWPVGDESTRQWMQDFYRAKLNEGLSTPEAVHRASLQILEQRAASHVSTHPVHWGSFVSAGEWQ